MPTEASAPEHGPDPGSLEVGLSAADVMLIRRHLAEPVEPVDDATREAMIAEAIRRADADAKDEEGCA